MTDGGIHIPVIPVPVSVLYVSVLAFLFLHVFACVVFSFCVYADAVRIPVPLILQMDNCRRLWYFCLRVFRR